MGDQDRLWQRLKGRYLKQVRKALARTKHPRCAEIIEEVESHLDQRYASLTQNQRTADGLAAIIEQMGPPVDFAELLEPSSAVGTARRRGRLKYLCSAGLPAVAPGNIDIQFRPAGRGERVQAILYEGRDIRRTGLTVKPGQEVRDIQIVVAKDGNE